MTTPRTTSRRLIAASAATGPWILPEVWKTPPDPVARPLRPQGVSHTSLDGAAAHRLHRPGGGSPRTTATPTNRRWTQEAKN